MLVVQEVGSESVPQAPVESFLADVAERGMTEVVAQPDGLYQVLVQPQGAGDGARDLRDLPGVGQPGPVVVARGRAEYLRLVLEAPERLGVDDPVAVALERRPQPAVRLRALAACRVGAGGERRELGLLSGPHPLRERLSHRAAGVLLAGFENSITHRRRF